jgi:4'-phosphopantetheinyl transferase EntD
MVGLFSSHVVTACGAPGEWRETAYAIEMKSVERAVEKRRREFVAGRHFARCALRQLGCADVAIPVGEKRQPVWPAGITGSISHTRGFCGVAVARLSAVRGLGFDVERISDVRPGISAQIVSDKEMADLRHAIGGGSERALALAFSGKEAFFKFQYPLSGQWVDLLDVHLGVDGEGFRVTPSIDIPDVCMRGETVCGRYTFRGDFVLTGIEVEAPPDRERRDGAVPVDFSQLRR